MTKRPWLKAALFLGGLIALGTGQARAQGNLVLYCSVNEGWCRALATTFTQQTGIRVDMTRQSSGEVYARLRAERNNPRADIWFGGTGDPHLQAAGEELTEVYQSPTTPSLHDWAQRQAQRANNRTTGVYMGALGYGYNETERRRRNLPTPACWSDLLRPEFRGEVQMADPNASGTAYTMLATLVQLMGEEGAFDYLKRLHRNIDQYPSTGAAPAQAAARGETLIGIVFQHDAVDAQRLNPNLRVVSPCEGTGFEIGSMSIIRGARNAEAARRFYEWVLTPAAQALGASNGSLQIPSNPATPLPQGSPDLSQIRLIDYDFAKYGSTAERNRLLQRWTREVKNAR